MILLDMKMILEEFNINAGKLRFPYILMYYNTDINRNANVGFIFIFRSLRRKIQ